MVSSKEPQLPNSEAALRGVDKATALLLTMSKASADRIIKQFEDSDIRAIAQSAMELPSVGAGTLALIIGELRASMDVADPLVGSPKGAKDLLSGLVSDEAVDAFLGAPTHDAAPSTWDALEAIEAVDIATIIAEEHDQVGACLLSKLTPAKAATVIEALPPDTQSELGLRLMSLKTVGKPALRLMERWIAQKVASRSPEADMVDQHAKLAAILNRLERNDASAILERLEAVQPDDARRVRQFVFSFEDVVNLTLEDRAILFDQVPTERTISALRDCDSALCLAVLSALSPRSRRVIEAELSGPDRAPPSVISEARREIADRAPELASKSLINLGTAHA